MEVNKEGKKKDNNRKMKTVGRNEGKKERKEKDGREIMYMYILL